MHPWPRAAAASYAEKSTFRRCVAAVGACVAIAGCAQARTHEFERHVCTYVVRPCVIMNAMPFIDLNSNADIPDRMQLG